ncbi:hypothetical protein GCM10027293_10410 [Pontibacter aydingkolensis]
MLITFSCRPNKAFFNQSSSEFLQEHPQFSSEFENKLRGIYTDKSLFGDVIFGVVDENGLVYSFALNREIIEGKATSLDNNSPLYIASSTKSFTGTLLKILEEEKKLDLNKSLDEYLPQLNYSDSIDTNKITIKSLLNHTHGTFSNSMTWKTAYLGYSGENEELIHDLNTDFLYDPSGKFRYSNVGPIIAGMVVENLTGKTWKAGMEENIFAPLNMDNTTASVSDHKLDEIRPSLIVSKERGVVDKGFYKSDVTMHAAGGMISTINDLSRWLSANIRQDSVLLSKDSWAALHASTTPQDKVYFTYRRTGYSLGWDVAQYQQEEILTRFGNLAGISFHISFMPEKKIGVIAFSNDNRAYLLPHLMANYAYNMLNALPADSIFQSERARFEEAFKSENEIVYPEASQLLTQSTGNDSILGTYHNRGNWPTISVIKEGNHYNMKWGILSGPIYKKEKGGNQSNLGLLTRDFEIRNDTLKTGSLTYIKAKQ